MSTDKKLLFSVAGLIENQIYTPIARLLIGCVLVLDIWNNANIFG